MKPSLFVYIKLQLPSQAQKKQNKQLSEGVMTSDGVMTTREVLFLTQNNKYWVELQKNPTYVSLYSKWPKTD